MVAVAEGNNVAVALIIENLLHMRDASILVRFSVIFARVRIKIKGGLNNSTSKDKREKRIN